MSLFSDELAKRGPSGATEPGSDMGLLEGSIKSAIWSPLSLVGVEAPAKLEAWRGEHPLASFLSQLAGYTVPYAGWAKVAKGIGPLQKAVSVAGASVKDAPFKAAFAREVVRFAPFEAGRIGGAALFGEDLAKGLGTEFTGTGDVALQAGLDLALVGATSGAFEALAAAGKRARPEDVLPGVDLSKPPQMQIRQLKENIENGLVADKDFALARLEHLKREVRSLQRPRKSRIVNALEEEGDARAVRRLFTEKSSPALVRSRLLRTASGIFQNREAIDDVVTRSGLGQDFEAFVQTPRYVNAKTPEARKIVSSILLRNLKPLDTERGWYYNRDIKDGLWVMARKFSDGEWMLFKTDDPGRFVPDRAAFAKTALQRAAVFGGEQKPKLPLEPEAEVFNAGQAFDQSVPLIDMRGLDPRKGSAVELTNTLVEKAGIGKLADVSGSVAEGAGKFARAYLTPGMLQFNNPTAARAFNLAKAVNDAAEGTAERLFVGSKDFALGSKNIFKEIWRGAAPVISDDSILALSEELYKDPKQWEAFWRTVNSMSSIEDGIKNYGLSSLGVKLSKALESADDFVIKGTTATQNAAGAPKQIRVLPLHRLISHTWKGDFRVPIYDGNRPIGFASGFKRGLAQDEARAIVEAAKADGLALRMGSVKMTGELEQDLRLLRGLSEDGMRLFGKMKDKAYLLRNAPTRLVEERKGLQFYTGHQKPWTLDEFQGLVLKQLRDYQKYQGKLTTDFFIKDDLSKLALTDRSAYDQVVHRINSIYGEQGGFSKAINKASDALLGPLLGRNSADKIVGAANKTLFRWTLGFINTGFNVANSLAFVQTAYPHIAFLTTAAPSRIAQYYTYWPVKGQKAVGAVGVLDMGKLTKKSFQLMRDPDDVLWEMYRRAAKEGVTDPRFLEEYVGQKASALANMRGVLKGEEPYSSWLGAAAEFFPSLTEKFSRSHSFTLGYTFFKDIMGVKNPETLYQLSKQFTEKVQFLYSTGDRARIITGPLGSAAGLFKNWVMHQIAWMAEYTGEGVLRGNWKPLLWMMGSTTAIGGIGALPFYATADGMSKWLSDKSIMEHTYGAFGGTEREGMGSISDAVFYGLPAFLNFSIQNQVAAPFMDPGKDAARLFSMVYLDRLKYAQRAFGQAIDHWSTTGESPVKDPRTRDLMMRAFAPKSLYQASAVIQDETLRSLSTGHPVTQLSPAERLMYGLGLNPRWVESSYRVADELWKDQNKMREAVSSYGEAWAQLQEAGDNRGLEQLIVRALYEGVDVSSVVKSAQARLAKGREDIIERQFKPSEILKFRELGLVANP